MSKCKDYCYDEFHVADICNCRIHPAQITWKEEWLSSLLCFRSLLFKQLEEWKCSLFLFLFEDSGWTILSCLLANEARIFNSSSNSECYFSTEEVSASWESTIIPLWATQQYNPILKIESNSHLDLTNLVTLELTIHGSWYSGDLPWQLSRHLNDEENPWDHSLVILYKIIPHLRQFVFDPRNQPTAVNKFQSHIVIIVPQSISKIQIQV